MLTDRIQQAGEQEFARRAGPGKKTQDQTSRALAFPFLASKSRRIDESAIQFAPAEKALLEETIESCHYGRISQRALEFGDHIANAGIAANPKNFHEFELEQTQFLGASLGTKAVFEEPNHEGGMLPRFGEDVGEAGSGTGAQD